MEKSLTTPMNRFLNCIDIEIYIAVMNCAWKQKRLNSLVSVYSTLRNHLIPIFVCSQFCASSNNTLNNSCIPLLMSFSLYTVHSSSIPCNCYETIFIQSKHNHNLRRSNMEVLYSGVFNCLVCKICLYDREVMLTVLKSRESKCFHSPMKRKCYLVRKINDLYNLLGVRTTSRSISLKLE